MDKNISVTTIGDPLLSFYGTSNSCNGVSLLFEKVAKINSFTFLMETICGVNPLICCLFMNYEKQNISMSMGNLSDPASSISKNVNQI